MFSPLGFNTHYPVISLVCVSTLFRNRVFSTFKHIYDIIQYFWHVRWFCNIFLYISPTLIFPNDAPSRQQIPHFHYFERIFAILSIFLDIWPSLWQITKFITFSSFFLIFSTQFHIYFTSKRQSRTSQIISRSHT